MAIGSGDASRDTYLGMADDVVALVDLDTNRCIGPAGEQPLDAVTKGVGRVATTQEHLLYRVDLAIKVGPTSGHDRLGDHDASEESIAQVQRVLARFAVPGRGCLRGVTLVEIQAMYETFNRRSHDGQVTDSTLRRGNANCHRLPAMHPTTLDGVTGL